VADASLAAAAAAATAAGVNVSSSLPSLRTTRHRDTGHSSSTAQNRSLATSMSQYMSNLQDLGAINPLSPLSPQSPQLEHAGVVLTWNGLMCLSAFSGKNGLNVIARSMDKQMLLHFAISFDEAAPVGQYQTLLL
jgi:hypothetical protein